MKKIIVNRKEINTNYEEEFDIVSSEEKEDYDLYFRGEEESTEKFLERLIEYGYTYIRFGISFDNEIVAYCSGLQD